MVAVRRDATDSFKIGLGWRLEPQKMAGNYLACAPLRLPDVTGFIPNRAWRRRAEYNSGSGIATSASCPESDRFVDDGTGSSERTLLSASLPFANAYAGRYRFPTTTSGRAAGRQRFSSETRRAGNSKCFRKAIREGHDDSFEDRRALFKFDFDKESPGVASQLTFRWAFLEPRVGKREGGSTQQSIQGVWQTVEYTITGPAARTITVREPRPNLTIITARHYSRLEDQSDKPRPILADPARRAPTSCVRWGTFVGKPAPMSDR